MPKQLLEVKDFKGVNNQIDSSDAPPNIASYSENVDFYSEYGTLEGRIQDELLDIPNLTDTEDVYFIGIIGREQRTADIVYMNPTSTGSIYILPTVGYGGTGPESGSDRVAIALGSNTGQNLTGSSTSGSWSNTTTVAKGNSLHFNDMDNNRTPTWMGYLSYGQYWVDDEPDGTALTDGAVPTKTPSNLYLSKDRCDPIYTSVTVATADSGSASQGIINGYKYFYKYSFTYDGYQESWLSAGYAVGTSKYSAVNTNKVNVNITLGTVEDIPKRVSHINIYRAYAPAGGDEPTTPYRFLKQKAFADSDWGADGTTQVTIEDNGITTSSYEAITGINEVVEDTYINYSVSTEGNDFHFVGAGTHNTAGDVKNYIFRSKPFKYSVFDWSVDFLILPETPTALKFFNGRLYAFSESKIYRIEPNNFYIEDTFEGAGASHQKSVLTTEQGMFHFDNNHVYFNNGTNPIIISKPIEFPNFNSVLGDASTIESAYSLNYIFSSAENYGTDNYLIYNPKNNSIMISFYYNSTPLAWVYSIDMKSWYLWKTPATSSSPATIVKGSFIVDGRCYLCTVGAGGIYSVSTNIDKNTQVADRTDFTWISNKLMFGNNSQQKSLLKIDSDKSANVTISAIPINSYAVTEYDVDDTGEDDFENITTLTLPAKMYSTQIKITGTGAGRLSTVSLNYRTLRGTPT